MSAGLAVWGTAKEFVLKDKCLDRGGSWASNGSYCVNPDCAAEGSCQPSYNNVSICEGLPAGISWQESYFRLGMPISIKGDEYWFVGGGDTPPIKAVVRNGVLYELKCGT